jgi:pilus assembly protein CpaB
MRFDRRFMIVVGFSLLWALVVSGLFYRLAASSGKEPKGGRDKSLVVAARPLPLGAMLDAASVKISGIPENRFPKGGFSRMEDVIGRPVVSPIEPDEAVMEARLGARGSGAGLSPMIPPGMRAISVRVNDVVGVSGFVLPGMRVDVLVTGHPQERDDTVTATVLQNVPVLSAGTTIQADSKSQPINATVVTLLVTPAQAEALTLANLEGKIQLVLRNSTDHEVNQTMGRHLRDLYSRELSPTERLATPLSETIKSTVPRRKPTVVATERLAAAPVSPVVLASDGDEVLMIRGNLKSVEAPAKAGK